MTFKDLAKRISTCYNSLPALIDALRDGFNEVEGGGSSDIEYSTTERKIGKWIDGTTDVYEKSYDLSNISFSNSAVTIDSTLTSANCVIVDYKGGVYNSSGLGASLCGLPGVDQWSYGIHLATALVLYSNNSYAVSALAGGRIVCTVRYIKK